MVINRRTFSWPRFCTLLPLALFFLLLVHCGAATVPPPTTPEHCGGRSCEGHADCKINVPVCGVTNTAYCLLDPPRECAWKLDTTNANCRCIEHDIRLCTTSSGVAGNQICTKVSATAADWSTCVPCPTCTAQ
jgi:hypothetical protein